MTGRRLALLWCAAVVVLLVPPAFVVMALVAEPATRPVVTVTVPVPAPVRAPEVAPVQDYGPWAARIGAVTGIPARALVAYAHTEVRLAAESPGCNLSWATLAGVASVESDHGRFGGRALDSDGRPSSSIVGIPLDGGPAVAAIPDTDDGLLDGDAEWDRAVGPLQFIPGTWREWAQDGDGDGRRDPQDLDDAALAAGRYLCAAGDLSTRDGWQRAVLRYNASDSYLRTVLRATNTYAAASKGG